MKTLNHGGGLAGEILPRTRRDPAFPIPRNGVDPMDVAKLAMACEQAFLASPFDEKVAAWRTLGTFAAISTSRWRRAWRSPPSAAMRTGWAGIMSEPSRLVYRFRFMLPPYQRARRRAPWHPPEGPEPGLGPVRHGPAHHGKGHFGGRPGGLRIPPKRPIALEAQLGAGGPCRPGATTHPGLVAGAIEYSVRPGFYNLVIAEGSWWESAPPGPFRPAATRPWPRGTGGAAGHPKDETVS